MPILGASRLTHTMTTAGREMTELHKEGGAPLQAFSLPPLPEAFSRAMLQHAALLQEPRQLRVDPAGTSAATSPPEPSPADALMLRACPCQSVSIRPSATGILCWHVAARLAACLYHMQGQSTGIYQQHQDTLHSALELQARPHWQC